MAEVIKVRNEPAQHIGVVNSAPCPEMNIVAKEITENGRYEARTDGVTGFDPVIVNVPSREEIGYENGYAAGYDEGYDKGYEVAGEYSVTEEDLTFSGNIQYLFRYNTWSQFIKRFGKMMRFNNITDAAELFYYSDSIEDLSELNMSLDGCSLARAFYRCSSLQKLPNVTGSVNFYFDSLFEKCYHLTSNECNKFFNSLTYKLPSSGSTGFGNMFQGCYSLRDLTTTLDWIDNHANHYDKTSSQIFSFLNFLNAASSLDEITNFPVIRLDRENTSNSFSGTFNACGRVKNVMFKTDNGVPYKVKWKSQTIDLSVNVGYGTSHSQFIDYNSGITRDKLVNSNESYKRLKDDPDWYTASAGSQYSRYNHDSAVNTINSLPDTSEYLASAGGTNTIKFRGTNGAYTDGGAISNLTAEEIAVATAKGWTVTLS